MSNDKVMMRYLDDEVTNGVIASGIDLATRLCFDIAEGHGWHANVAGAGEPRDPLILLALIASEVGEAIEACRQSAPYVSDHIPPHSGLAEELADILVRVFDMAGEHQIDLSGAFAAKVAFNITRPYRHGNKVY